MRIYSEAIHNIAYIEGVGEAYTGSLTATLNNDLISIYHSGVGLYQVKDLPFTLIQDQNGVGFQSGQDTLNYLNQIFVVQLNASITIYQNSPLASWTVNHNLGYYPNVKVYSTGGAEIDAEVLNISVNQVQIIFNTPTSGFARLF